MKHFIIFLFFLFAALNIFSLGKKEADNSSQNPPPGANNTVNIVGQIRIFGSEPHTFVGIVDQNGVEYAVYSPHREAELRRLQGNLIEFTVVMLDEPRSFGGIFLRGGTVTPL